MTPQGRKLALGSAMAAALAVTAMVSFQAGVHAQTPAPAPRVEKQVMDNARFNIRSIPTLALFVGGREVARQPGAMGLQDITRWVQSQLPR